MAPYFSRTSPADSRSNACAGEAGSEGVAYTMTLKARLEFANNIDNLKVASALGPDTLFVRNFVFNESPHPRGCAWMMITFGTVSEQHIPCMFRAIGIFLEKMQSLDDCHRICETMNFIDDYDGLWNGSPDERANEIIQRLPTKVRVEARAGW